MTGTADSSYPVVALPAATAREALDLITLAALMLPALRARARQGTLTPASLEQLTTLLTSGRQDSAALVSRLEAAQRELAAVLLAQEAP